MLSESYKYVEGISKPFESLTESQKQFIGVEIETDYGSTLKVVSASNKQISNNTLLYLNVVFVVKTKSYGLLVLYK